MGCRRCVSCASLGQRVSFSEFPDDKSFDLHVFRDANEVAYGVVA